MRESLFKKLDKAIFKAIDNLKLSPQFNQAASSLEGLPDEYQKVANQGITYLITAIPFLILLIFFIINLSVRSRITAKEELIEKIAQMNESQAKVSRIGDNLVSSMSLGSQTSLNKQLSDLSSQFSIESSALALKDYSQSASGSLKKTQATIRFKKLSTNKLSALLQEFVIKKGVRVQKINLKKGSETLSGEIEFYHFARAGNTP